jgi:hypothetical protein
MLRFYWTLIRGIPRAIYNAADPTLSVTAVIVFFGMVFNRRLGEKLLTSWHAISPWWSLVPVGIFFAYALMKSNYEHFRQSEAGLIQRLSSKELECSQLQTKYATALLEISDLKKPKRSAGEVDRYKQVEAQLRKCSNEAIAMLKHLQIHGNVNMGMHSSILPNGMSNAVAQEVLAELYQAHLLTRRQEGRIGDMRYEIAPGMKAALDELLYTRQ